MISDKKIRIIIRKNTNLNDLNSKIEKLIPILGKYRYIVINMYGFGKGELLETIRPLTTRNILSTLVVYSDEEGKHIDCDEEIVVS